MLKESIWPLGRLKFRATTEAPALFMLSTPLTGISVLKVKQELMAICMTPERLLLDCVSEPARVKFELALALDVPLITYRPCVNGMGVAEAEGFCEPELLLPPHPAITRQKKVNIRIA